MRFSTDGLSHYLKTKALDVGFGAARTVSSTRCSGGGGPCGLDGRTLVILLEGLGDSIAFTPALRALRRSYPRARIDLLVNDVSYEVYRTTPYADGFIRRSGGSGRRYGFVSLLSTLRANRYRVAITPSLLFRHISLTYLSGAPVRVGFDVAGRGIALNVPLTLDRGKSRVHCYMDLARALGASDHGDHMEIEIAHEDESKASELLRRTGGLESGPLVVIHPGAKQAVNEWPPARYARLADRLRREAGAFVAFTGSEADRPLVRTICSIMHDKAASLAGETTLRELAAVFKRCDLLVCPDTGAMHLGCAVGAPMVVLMGGRNGPAEWRPLSPAATVLRHEVPCSPCRRSVCVNGDLQCMRSTSLEEVVEASLLRLAARSEADDLLNCARAPTGARGRRRNAVW